MQMGRCALGSGAGRLAAVAGLLLSAAGMYGQDYGVQVPAAVNLSCDGKGSAATNVSTYTPMLSWRFQDDDTGDGQTACGIRVGSLPGASDKWLVTESVLATSSVMYGGDDLDPNTTYYWAVQVRDRASQWSDFAEDSFEVLDIGFRAYDGTSVIKIVTDDNEAAHQLRVRANGETYGIVVADPSEHGASGIRVQTATGVRALRKMVAPPPSVGLSSGALTFAWEAPEPAAQTVSVTNTGGGTLSGLNASVIYGSGSGWLTATLDRTTAPATVTVTASRGTLTAGTYDATVRVASSGAGISAQDVSVAFTIAAIGLSPTNLSFSVVSGGASPSAQTVSVSNTGDGTLIDLNASVVYISGSGWLTASLDPATAPATLTVTATQGALAAGTYTATVEVASSLAANGPQSVSVSFAISPPAGRVAYVYSSSSSQATGYRNLFEASGWLAVVVPMGQVASYDFSPFDIIAVGTDTGWLGTWATASEVLAIDGSGKPVIGFGEGGYAFFGQLGLDIGYPRGWHLSEPGIVAVDPTSTVFTTPNLIQLPVDNAMQVYTATSSVGIYLPAIPTDVVVIGREVGDEDHYSVVQEGNRYLLWGYTGSAADLTQNGAYLLLNVMGGIPIQGPALAPPSGLRILP